MKKTLIVFATGWGPQHGGINSLNIDLLCAFQALHQGAVQTICVVLNADAASIEQAQQTHGIVLLSLAQSGVKKLGAELEPQAWEGLQALLPVLPEQLVWLGHDSITGAIALAAKEKRGGTLALIHHMSYDHYESYAASSSQAEAKTNKQKELFAQADVVLAVGPLLRDKLKSWQLMSSPVMLIPGLADELLKKAAKTQAAANFCCFLSGRLSEDAKKVKQAQLGIAAFGQAIKQADSNPWVPNILKNGSRAKLLLRGVDFEDEADGSVSESEQNFLEFAEQYAGRVYTCQALPYTNARASLFTDLCSASVALMPSWHEGFGLVGWEAIAAGVPLVLSTNSGLYRLLEEWDDGLYKSLVVELDVQGFTREPFFTDADLSNAANAITQIALDTSGWQKKAEKLRRALEKEFTWRNCAQKLSQALAWEAPAELPTPTTPPALTPIPHQAKTPARIHLLNLPEKRWKRGDGLDSYLLRADEAVIPFDAHRLPFLQAQLAWAKDGEFNMAVRLLVGEGGVGKTRLAQEICQHLIAEGWQTGFLRGDAQVAQMKEFVNQLRECGQPCLVVVDYAECRQDTLRELIKRLQKAARSQSVRLLLLARDGSDWWRIFVSKDAECSAFLTGPASSGPISLPKLHDSLEHRQAAFRIAINEFAKRVEKPIPEQQVDLSDEHYAHPLYIQMAAMASLFGEKSLTAESLPALIRDHELRYWDGALRQMPNYNDLLFKQAQYLMALVILSDGIPNARQVEKLWQSLGCEKASLAPLFDQLAQFYPNNGGIMPLRPDLLGEALVAQVLQLQMGPKLLDACLYSSMPALRYSSLTVLARLANRRSDLLPCIEQALLRNFSKCALEAVLVCIATPNPLIQQLDTGFKNAKSSERVKFAEMLRDAQAGEVDAMKGLVKLLLPAKLDEMRKRKAKLKESEKKEYLNLLLMMAEIHVEEEEWALALANRREAELMLCAGGGSKSDEKNERLGRVLEGIAYCLDALGESDAAVIESGKAVSIFTGLAKNNSQQYDATWADLLNNHANRLAELGRAEEALSTSAQAVEIRARLAEADPKKYEVVWADSLYNHTIYLAEMGRVEEALSTSAQEIEIRARLAEADPKKYEAAWASSLHNHANHLAELGRAEEALSTSAQAVEIRARLAEADPKKYEAVWAASLHNHAIRLAAMGRAEEALSTSAQAVEIRARLAEADPKKYEGAWADSLHNHAIGLGGKGDFAAAAELQKQCLSIYQRCEERDEGKWQYAVCRTALNLCLWSYLENAQAQLLVPELPLFSNGHHLEHAKLQFYHAFLNACAKQDANSVQYALEKWQALNSVQQIAYSEEGSILALLVIRYLGEQCAPAGWKEIYQRMHKNRQGRIPVWMSKLAERIGVSLPSTQG